MLLPKSKDNIYPKTRENITHLLTFYFDNLDLKKEDEIEYILSFTSLSLNQIEFIVKKLSESWNNIFKDFFGKNKTTLKNLLRYGIDGLTKNEDDWSFGPHSSGRPIIKEFIKYVEKSEN